MRISRCVAASTVLALAAWSGLTGGAVARAGYILPRPDRDSLRLPEKVEEVDRAVESFRRREYERSFALLKDAAGKHPGLFTPRVLFAKLCLLQGQPALGRAALEQAIVEDPGHPEAYVILARLALEDGRLTEAALLLEKAEALTPAVNLSEDLRREVRIDCRAGLADVAGRRKDWPAAEAHLTAWLALEPAQGKVRQRLALALFRRGRRDAAFAELERAARDDPASDAAEVVMGQFWAEERDFDQAAAWMEKGVKRAPRDAKVRLAYASWLLERGRIDEARDQADAATRLDPGSADIRGLRGMIAWQLKDYEQAERTFRGLHEEAPADFAASNQWALALAEQPSDAKRRRALELAEVNARLYPGSAAALTTLGLASYRLGRMDDAERALRAALATGSAGPDAAYDLARVLADRGRPDEVKPLLKLALAAPGHFAARKDAREWYDKLAR